jgi:hypothetical protein
VSDAPPPPSKADVIAVVKAVLNGSMTRTEASTWARPWVGAVDAGVHDRSVWNALKLLGAIDLRHGDDAPYLYDDEQVATWRDELLGDP